MSWDVCWAAFYKGTWKGILEHLYIFIFIARKCCPPFPEETLSMYTRTLLLLLMDLICRSDPQAIISATSPFSKRDEVLFKYTYFSMSAGEVAFDRIQDRSRIKKEEREMRAIFFPSAKLFVSLVLRRVVCLLWRLFPFLPLSHIFLLPLSFPPVAVFSSIFYSNLHGEIECVSMDNLIKAPMMYTCLIVFH